MAVKSSSDTNANTTKSPSRTEVWKMFDRIAHRYDLLNRMLSMGQDVVWRKRVARHLPDYSNQHILDLATGTGDLIISIFEKSERVKSGIGIDMAEKMLEFGRPKLRKKNLDQAITLQKGDAMDIPFPAESFDAVTIAFGIRNVIDVPESMREMFRVLKPAGRVIILEFSLPGNRVFRSLYLFYFRKVLPVIGGLISGDSYAYRYLNETVETFPYREEFCQLLREAGFSDVKMTPLTFGIATIYQGDKEGDNDVVD